MRRESFTIVSILGTLVLVSFRLIPGRLLGLDVYRTCSNLADRLPSRWFVGLPQLGNPAIHTVETLPSSASPHNCSTRHIVTKSRTSAEFRPRAFLRRTPARKLWSTHLGDLTVFTFPMSRGPCPVD